MTHNLIAGKAGFGNLMDVYNGDQILKFRDRIKKYIKDISLNSSRECEFVYKGENPNETLKKPL